MKSKLYPLNKPSINAASGSSYLFITAFILICTCNTACQKDFIINVKANKPLLVVEAYINNKMPNYNYVILSRSIDYMSLNFENTPVSDATVTITEGEQVNEEYRWDTTTKVQMLSIPVPGTPADLTNIYFDPRLAIDPSSALLGKPGKSYLLEISEGGNQYSAITTLLHPVQIDSLTIGYPYRDEDDENKLKFRITNHYQDPDTLNNTQLFFYRSFADITSFGWGTFFINRYSSFGTDELTNGEYIRLTHFRGFEPGDTVEYHMASVTRDVYSFWEHFNNARNNGGPFATPVTLNTNITGPDVTGCFCGLSLSSKAIIIY